MSQLHGTKWKGVPLSVIYQAATPWKTSEIPLLMADFKHNALYDNYYSDLEMANSDDDQHYVKLPFYQESDTFTNNNGETETVFRWDIIKKVLTKHNIQNCKDLTETILSYNVSFKNIWKFEALEKLFNEYLDAEEGQEFFSVILPKICKLALMLPNLIQKPIPLLKQNENKSLSLTQLQVASILANAFMCTFSKLKKDPSEKPTYPRFNFNTLFETSGAPHVLEKIKCIIHYFKKVNIEGPGNIITVLRRSLPSSGFPDWSASDQLLSIPLHIDSETYIEDADGLVQVDFANRFLGGGVLRRGCVQEEIRFVICPELIVSMLFTEEMKPNEAVMIIGCERFSNFTGYSQTFRFTGDFDDTTPLDTAGRRRCAILAMDATRYTNIWQQYDKERLDREINKAYVGMSFGTNDNIPKCPGIATGNWRCGAYRGNPHLKSLIQIMACAQSKRPMAYYTFGDADLRDNIHNMFIMLNKHNVTVGQLYNYLVSYFDTDVRRNKLYSHLRRLLGEETEQDREDALNNRRNKKKTKQKLKGRDYLSSECIMAENNVAQLFQEDSL